MTETTLSPIDLAIPPKQIITDYRTVFRSRQVSLVSHREVMSGKAKFGIFGDGKELPQIAMAKVFRKGDLPVKAHLESGVYHLEIPFDEQTKSECVC